MSAILNSNKIRKDPEDDTQVNCSALIFTGYADKMDELVTFNAGLTSRIKYTSTFQNYMPRELARIICDVVKNF